MKLVGMAGIDLVHATLALAVGLVAVPSVQGAGWTVDLKPQVTLEAGAVRLGDLSATPLPPRMANMVVVAGGKPGTAVATDRKTILRQMVNQDLASGVRFRGAETCQVHFSGESVSTGLLREEIRHQVQALVPSGRDGAPESWFELEIPDRDLSAGSNWQVRLDRTQPLEPGRNLIRVGFLDGAHSESINITVTFHSFGEVARVRTPIERNSPLDPDAFAWEWQDLSTLDGRPVVGRGQVLGASTVRSLAAGDLLRNSDLKATPLIRSGDSVDLLVTRGSVSVKVRAFARQSGTLGQTIPVKNQLTGRLVNARVAGPGLVEWRR